jgi:hypothetical protein
MLSHIRRTRFALLAAIPIAMVSSGVAQSAVDTTTFTVTATIARRANRTNLKLN